MSLISLFVNASFIVKMVMLILVLLSLISWAFIFQRSQVLREYYKRLSKFETKFWSGIDLKEYNKKLTAKNYELSGQEAIFVAGFNEFLRLHYKSGASPEIVMNAVSRSMQIAMNKEIEKLEQTLPFLATVQSMSPYIGLFGTVWGIMHSFRQLSTVQQATIAMVAPGISEALIATAMGLIAAIPAGIAYNRYSGKVDKIANQYKIFSEEFLGFLNRKALLAE